MLQFLQPAIEYVADLGGIATDQFKIVLCLLLSYPLSGVLKRLPDSSPVTKNLYVIATALFFLVGVFDLWSGLRTLFISGAGTWLLCRYLKSPLMPWINFFFIMGHMSIK